MAFPVTWRRGRRAHLDVGGERGVAIRQALSDQLGLVVEEVTPFGLAGSAGSTPLRITVTGDPPAQLFGKLYAQSHLRADRWYKLGRELLYGRLEDEKPFNTVRRLVQSVPSAARVPCVRLSPGWTVAGANARNGWSEFVLDHDRAGGRAVVVRLTTACDPAGAPEVPSPAPGTRRHQRVEQRTGEFTATWYDRFPGGCVTYRLHSTADLEGRFATEAPGILGLVTRAALQQALEQRSDGRLRLDPGSPR